MQSREKKDLMFLRLFPGENVHTELKNACKIHKVKTAVVLSGIGQLKEIQLGYFKEKGNYLPESFKGPLELLSLNGNAVKQEGKYILHLHAAFGDEKKNVIGGHLIAGIVEVTNEIVLLKTSMDVERKLDQETGLESMFLE